jgi:hypothetical protein
MAEAAQAIARARSEAQTAVAAALEEAKSAAAAQSASLNQQLDVKLKAAEAAGTAKRAHRRWLRPGRRAVW